VVAADGKKSADSLQPPSDSILNDVPISSFRKMAHLGGGQFVIPLGPLPIFEILMSLPIFPTLA
jgi:hypothetical protein